MQKGMTWNEILRAQNRLLEDRSSRWQDIYRKFWEILRNKAVQRQKNEIKGKTKPKKGKDGFDSFGLPKVW